MCLGPASRSWGRIDKNSKGEGERSGRSTVCRFTANAGIWAAQAGKGIRDL